MTIEAILLTHCHFDHIGAVAPVAEATGAPVYCPEIEVPVLADIMSFVPWPGFGPFESYDADETVAGGETLELAGLEIDVIFTPGHSPGHVTYSIPDEEAIFSGDVLFQGSVGRVDLPGRRLGRPCSSAIRGAASTPIPTETTVYPGHMGITTLGAERATNSVPRRARPVGPGRSASKVARSMAEQVPGPARHLRRPARRTRPRGRGSSRPRARSSSAPATGGSRRPVFEDTELFERGVGAARPTSSARRCSPSRTRAGAASPCGPRATAPICRAYLEHGMQKLAQPVKLWYVGPVLPPRAPAGGPLPPVPPARRRGDRLRLAARRRRADRAARRPAARQLGSRGSSCGSAASARSESRGAYLERAAAPTCARTRASSPRTCASGSTTTRCAPSTPRTRARRR